jgi:hypothetical protein
MSIHLSPKPPHRDQQDASTAWLLKELIIQPGLDSSIFVEAERQSRPRKPPQRLDDAKLEQINHFGDEQKFTSTSHGGMITKSFLEGRSQWIDEPIIAGWREPTEKISATLRLADELFAKWSQPRGRPFDPFFDPLWLETAKTLRDAGLPWHNNNLNMPDEIDSRYVFSHVLFGLISLSSSSSGLRC